MQLLDKSITYKISKINPKFKKINKNKATVHWFQNINKIQKKTQMKKKLKNSVNK